MNAQSMSSMMTSMIRGQIFTNNVNDPKVITALQKVPRELFVAENLQAVAYADEAILLKANPKRYLPQPLVFARMLQFAKLEPTHRVLDVASAGGYTSAVISSLVKDVISLESDAKLTAIAKANIAKLGIENIKLVTGDLILGGADYKTFDIIFIEGTAEYVPEALLKQLKIGGRLVAVIAPQGSNIGNIVVMEKGEKAIANTTYFQAIANKLEEFTKEVEFKFFSAT